MPAGPIGSCWASGSWTDVSWEADTWANDAPTGVTITTTGLPPGVEGVAYSRTVEATGGVEPYTWSLHSGTLPTGLTLHAATGVIDGTPTVPGVYPFEIKVTDADLETDTQPLSIVIFGSSGPGQYPRGSRYRTGFRETWKTGR